MPWSDEFIDMLGQPELVPLYLLESVEIGTFDPTSSPLRLSSFATQGYLECLSREGSSVTYGELTPGTWERTYGELRLGLTDDIRGLVARGQAVRLLVGFPGWDVGRFQSVWLGVVRNLTWSSGTGWVLQCAEMPGALQNRFDSAADQQSLFYNLPASTKLSADYDPALDSALIVNSVAGIEANSSGLYAMRITPGGSNEYYVTSSLLTTLTFSGLTAGAFDSPLTDATPPVIGTPKETKKGDAVEAIAWIRAHPIYFALRVLTSTGTGTNGPHDLLPVSWGYGIPYGLVDLRDAETYKVVTTPALFEHWDFLVDHSQQDGVSWMAELLRPGGFFVGQHQGCLTARAVGKPNGSLSLQTISLDDDDIVSLSYETWDSTSPVEYRKMRVHGYNSTYIYSLTENSLASRPTRANRRRDLPNAFSDVSSDVNGWTKEVGDRLGLYDTRVPEHVTVETVGWTAAVASLGSLVRLTTAFLGARDAPAGRPLFEGDTLLVIGGGPDWFGSSCRLELLYLTPESARA